MQETKKPKIIIPDETLIMTIIRLEVIDLTVKFNNVASVWVSKDLLSLKGYLKSIPQTTQLYSSYYKDIWLYMEGNKV